LNMPTSGISSLVFLNTRQTITQRKSTRLKGESYFFPQLYMSGE
jgi:hypothetical protein